MGRQGRDLAILEALEELMRFDRRLAITLAVLALLVVLGVIFWGYALG